MHSVFGESFAADEGLPVEEDLVRRQHRANGTDYEAGCRCTVCRKANSTRNMRRRRERWAMRELIDGRLVAVGREHGKRSTYTNWGCRCAACTAVGNIYLSGGRAKKES